MGLAGVPLNPANMIGLPLIVGVGVDNGVHVLHDYLLRRREGRSTISRAIGRGVLVKAPKSSQDLRFDLPTVGPTTVDGAAKAGLAGIAIVAGNTIAADSQAMIVAADTAGLFILGLTA